MNRTVRRLALAAALACMLLPAAASAGLSLEEMTASTEGRASFTQEGLPQAEYESAVSTAGWVDIVTLAEAEPLSYDVSEAVTWEETESLLLGMAAHEGVRLTAIGKSAEGRRIYSVSVGYGSEVVLLAGGMRARETAGTAYILRQLCTLITQLDEGDSRVSTLLGQYTVVAVPCCDPDGRAVMDDRPYAEWRANANGVDLCLNFPTSAAGQLAAGARQNAHETQPSPAGWPGPYLGSESETRALMGWLEHYIGSARVLLEYEQYGRYIHAGLPWLTAASQERCAQLAEAVRAALSVDGAEYAVVAPEEPLHGWGCASLREYALELAEGLVFGEEYGRLGLYDGADVLPLCFYESLEVHGDAHEVRSPGFAAVTVEVSTKGGVGYYDNARRNQAKEYENCDYDDLLPTVMEFVWASLSDE